MQKWAGANHGEHKSIFISLQTSFWEAFFVFYVLPDQEWKLKLVQHNSSEGKLYNV